MPAVRVQLPSGPAFRPALVEAAEKYAARRGFSSAGEAEFCELVSVAIDACAATDADMVEMTFEEHAEAIAVLVCGLQGSSPIGPAAAAALTKRFRSATSLAITDSTVAFRVERV